ncbi:CBS domain-containing protein [Parasporobacterium paucivorans]|uniref:CBS domain-containing protein n=1 Tax=Parasporobacterium paucivorans DSM 15970 TaxID=1122934 RepID=A0A1M6ACS3_9FIRM|nr:CBS domain-containing protein [Parasporobacterium paucivorans]SHI34178.1 CBS domain-containing protein [Parasporobacterium paucivorans DSM 15970]
MNVLFFLKPKSEVDYIFNTDTVKEALMVMAKRNYTAVPIINRMGKLAGTITDRDIVQYMQENSSLCLNDIQDMPIRMIKRNRDNIPVNANANIEDMMSKALNQNFVPVVDDDNKFIGIVTRKDIMEQWNNKYIQNRFAMG